MGRCGVRVAEKKDPRMTDQTLHVEPPVSFANNTLVNETTRCTLVEKAAGSSEEFWAGIASRLEWSRPFTKVKDVSFDADDLHIKWFEDGQLNAASNCLDRHLETRADQTAIIWEGDDPGDHEYITYREVHAEVCRMANILKARDVKKGDRVVIYMPMIPEAAYAMLA